jgi:hypothetical protein
MEDCKENIWTFIEREWWRIRQNKEIKDILHWNIL